MTSITRTLTVLTLLVLPSAAWAGEPSLQDFTNVLSSPSSAVPVVIFRAKEIVTLDPARPGPACRRWRWRAIGSSPPEPLPM